MKNPTDIGGPFCQRLLRLAYVTFFENWLMKLKCPRERSLMTSLVFWPFLTYLPTYLPTLSYSVTSLFGGNLGPPTYRNMGRH